jgi:hypothetical protein
MVTHTAVDVSPGEPLIRIAERILSEQLGEPVRLRWSETFPGGLAEKSTVIRCHVVEAPGEVASTVIVKQVRERLAFRYLPDSPQAPNAAHVFFDDWAALQFLGGIGGDLSLAPALYGGDRDAGVIVMEDLGADEGPSTHELLQGDDPARAEAALIDTIAAIGRLHAATIGRSEEYQGIRDALGPRPTPLPLYQDPWSNARGCSSPRDEIGAAVRQYEAGFTAIGLRPRAGVDGEIAAVTRAVEEDPGPFLAFCQGDQNGVGGCMRTGTTLRFFDFDCGGFRHALLEGIPARITWGGMVRVPERLLPRMDHVYQSELARGQERSDARGAVRDDGPFHRAMVEAAARWNIFHVAHRLPDALEADRLRGPSTLRQQVLAWIDAFAGLSEEFGHFPALGQSARDMAARLRALWPPEVHHVPYYPAFRS